MNFLVFLLIFKILYYIILSVEINSLTLIVIKNLSTLNFDSLTITLQFFIIDLLFNVNI